MNPRKRPKVLIGRTTLVETGCGHLYVTVNTDGAGQPFEVFATLGKAGGCGGAQSEAVARLISLSLRAGVDPDEVVSQLRGIQCPSPLFWEGVQVKSCADGIAKVLEEERGDPSETSFPETSRDP